MSIIYIPYVHGTMRKTAPQPEVARETYEGILKFTMANLAGWHDILVNVVARPKDGYNGTYEITFTTIPGLRGEISAMPDRETTVAPAYRGFAGDEEELEVIVWSLRDHHGAEFWNVSLRKREPILVDRAGDQDSSISS